MFIKELTLRNFRCFQERTIQFNGRIIIVEGPNGSGKSSILEALHYSCYLRSFRTHLNRELIQLGSNYFFINVSFLTLDALIDDRIQVGFSGAEGKVVKHNDKIIQSYKELLSLFRVVTLSADDLELVQGSPELRRDFLNYGLLLLEPSISVQLKRYKQILDQRNTLLSMGRNSTQSQDFIIWTQKLFEESLVLRNKRIAYLNLLSDSVNQLLSTYFLDADTQDLSVEFVYSPKNVYVDSFDEFWAAYQSKNVATEIAFGRSLFGVHLDDFTIIFHKKKARAYASRGQQKLLVLLMRLAQLQQLSLCSSEPGVLLLDDFVTDFDPKKIEMAFAALQSLDHQIFLSCPSNPEVFLQKLPKSDIEHIKI